MQRTAAIVESGVYEDFVGAVSTVT
jgi:hypothetical protein